MARVHRARPTVPRTVPRHGSARNTQQPHHQHTMVPSLATRYSSMDHGASDLLTGSAHPHERITSSRAMLPVSASEPLSDAPSPSTLAPSPSELATLKSKSSLSPHSDALSGAYHPAARIASSRSLVRKARRQASGKHWMFTGRIVIEGDVSPRRRSFQRVPSAA